MLPYQRIGLRNPGRAEPELVPSLDQFRSIKCRCINLESRNHARQRHVHACWDWWSLGYIDQTKTTSAIILLRLPFSLVSFGARVVGSCAACFFFSRPSLSSISGKQKTVKNGRQKAQLCRELRPERRGGRRVQDGGSSHRACQASCAEPR